MKITFIQAFKSTKDGRGTKAKEFFNHIFYIRGHMDGDETVFGETAEVREFHSFDDPMDVGLLKELLERYLSGAHVDYVQWMSGGMFNIQLPDNQALPESFRLEHLVTTVRLWFLEKKKVYHLFH